MPVRTSSPQTKRNFEPRFKAEDEPEKKKVWISYKQEFFIWDGKQWELISRRYGDVTTTAITAEIRNWMNSDGYKKLVNKKK